MDCLIPLEKKLFKSDKIPRYNYAQYTHKTCVSNTATEIIQKCVIFDKSVSKITKVCHSSESEFGKKYL